MGAVLSPDRILRELAELWVSTGKGDRAEAGDGVLRACSMTLLILAEASEDMQSLGETVAALMPEHPARVILIRLTGGSARALSERVYAQCWKPFGQRRQICCEQVEITVSDAALADLPAVVLPLAVADMPVILWCRAARLPGMPEFAAIAAVATKVVLDSAAMPDAKAAFDILAAAARSRLIGDLAWTRLTRWREMLAQVFGNRDLLAQIAAVARVSVSFGPSYETSARYMAAWTAEGLRAAGARPETAVQPAADVPTLKVEIEGPDLKIALARRGETLVATVNEISQCTSLPVAADCLVMREELGIVERDATFEVALAAALRLALPAD